MPTLPAMSICPLMRKISFAAVFGVALAVSGPAMAQGKVLATVNGETITEGDVEIAMEDVAAEYPNVPADKLKEMTLDFLIEVKVVAQKAKAEKLDQADAFKRKLVYVRDRVLMQQLLLNKAKEATSDAALKTFFDDQIKQVKPVEEARARHILVEKEEDAKAIHKRVKAGEDFAKIAQEASKDPGSGKEGGDLGFFTKERMVPEFGEAAFALKPGEISEPVKSQFGWHIIKLEEKRVKPLPTFDQVKERIAQALAGKAQSDFLKSLRDGAKIEKTEAAKPAEAKPAEPKKN